MILHDLRIALRSMLRQKAYTFINVAGLMISIAACLLVVLWVADELAYDRFHVKADRIYRATWNARFGDNEWNIPLVPVPLAPALETEFPEVERVVRFRTGTITARNGDQFQKEENVLFTEESFFDVFSVKFLEGNPSTSLQDPNTVVLTEETALRYFPDRSALGQSLEMNDGTLLHITGIVAEFPRQSHFHFDFLIPLKNLPIIEQRKTQWGSATVYTYLTLKDGQGRESLQAKLHRYIEQNVAGEAMRGTGNFTRFPMTPLTDLHLQSHLKYELEPNGNIVYVYLFSAIAGFILLLACVNFVNLATARSLKRSKEVAVRKVAGSNRAQLVRQFLIESFLHVLISVIGAIVLAEFVLPYFNTLSGKELDIATETPFVFGVAVALIGIVTVLAGAYPAVFLSSFKPLVALKGSNVSGSGVNRVRKILVVFQFSISIGLIAGTFIVRDQLTFIQSKYLGFDKEQVLVLKRANILGVRQNDFSRQLLQERAVVDVSAAQFLPGQIFDSMGFSLEQPANYEFTSLTYNWVDEHFVDVLKLTIASGRNFSPLLASDSTSFLINESAAKAIGWKEPLGKRISLGSFYSGPVIGVLKDFNFESLHQDMKPMVFLYNRRASSNLAVRLAPEMIEEGISAIRRDWEKAVPDAPFEYSFLDEDFQGLYHNEERLSRVFSVFSSLAVVIACLGLFGLASFIAEQRTKEIGIRKVLGATEMSIVGMLTAEFAGLILAALVISAPLSYFAMEEWLTGFAYRTAVDWRVFVLAGAVALAIALMTVSVQAIKAAMANPVKSLRYE